MVKLSPADVPSVAAACDAPVAAGPVVALEVLGASAGAALDTARDELIRSGAVAAGALALPSSGSAPDKLHTAFFGTDAMGRLASAGEFSGRMEDCTCVLILPSAVARGQAGAILEDLLAEVAKSAARGAGELRLTALALSDLDRRCAEEFLEVYKLVVPDFVVRQRPKPPCAV